MVERVRGWLAERRDVRIFTARVAIIARRSEHGKADEAFAAHQRTLIEAWCQDHLGQVLPITATKDFEMLELWDDRCVQMVPNTGNIVEGPQGAKQCPTCLKIYFLCGKPS